jgi:hypothetical protein
VQNYDRFLGQSGQENYDARNAGNGPMSILGQSDFTRVLSFALSRWVQPKSASFNQCQTELPWGSSRLSIS